MYETSISTQKFNKEVKKTYQNVVLPQTLSIQKYTPSVFLHFSSQMNIPPLVPAKMDHMDSDLVNAH